MENYIINVQAALILKEVAFFFNLVNANVYQDSTCHNMEKYVLHVILPVLNVLKKGKILVLNVKNQKQLITLDLI
jgi:hypothetical protein